MMRKIEKLRNNLIIQIGWVYTYESRDYKVLTATSEMLGDSGHTLNLTEPVYWLEDIETKEVIFVPEKVLKRELPLYNEVVMLGQNK